MGSRLIKFIKKAWGNLQVRILLILLMFLFLPVIITLNIYLLQTEQMIIDNSSRLIMNNLKQVGDKIETVCLNMITLSNLILTDDIILDNILFEPDLHPHEPYYRIKSLGEYTESDLKRITRIENQINSVKMDVFFKNNADVIIMGADGNMYFSISGSMVGRNLKTGNWNHVVESDKFKLLVLGERAALWEVPFKYKINGSDDIRYISFSKSLKNKHSPTDIAGILMINFSEASIRDIVGDSYSGSFILINDKGDVITSSDTNLEDEVMTNKEISSKSLFYGSGSLITNIDGQKYMVNYSSIARFGFCALSLTPYEDLIEEIYNLKHHIHSINIFIFVTFFIFGTLLIINTLRPIQRLARRMQGIKIGSYSIDTKETENLDDVNSLVHSFDKMLDSLQELVGIVVEEQKRESELRYQTLRAQINPHFLFNTLNTIRWSAKMSGANNIYKMISALGRLLEVSMNKGKEEITLREELELVKSYIYIQNVRYSDKFELRIHVEDDELYSYILLKLIVQPIVENSIMHGFVDKSEDCIIDIKVHREDEALIIDIIDNGIGMDSEKVDNLLYRGQASKQRLSGIGLNNVNERIQLKYGSQYGLSIESEKDMRTKVTIILPVIESIMGNAMEDVAE